MKNFKKLVLVVTVVGVVGVAGAVFASNIKTPAEIASLLTGKTVEDVYKERSKGKPFGVVANEAGKLDEFKTEMLEQKKIILDEKVKNGTLTQEKADEIINDIKNNQETCDGTGNGKFGSSFKQGQNGRGGQMGRGQRMYNKYE